MFGTLLPGALWTLAYLAVVALPLLVLLARPTAGAGFWWDLSMAFGLAALIVMGAQSLLTARFRRVASPFGLDILYYFHRWMGLGALLLVAGHWLVLKLTEPGALVPGLPGEAPSHMTAGRVALSLLVAILVTSLWRKPLRIPYDRWRVGHAALALGAVLLAVVHVVGAGDYTRAPLERGLLAVYGLGWAGLLVYSRLWRPARLAARPYRVVEVRPERGRSWSLVLEPDGHEGFRFLPGQFAWLTLRNSPFAAREHPFSLSGSAEVGPALTFTIRELGDFTRTIGTLQAGETAYVDGPHGAFTVDRHRGAPGFGFVAGGVGISPIMSMLMTLADRGDPRPLYLLYANNVWDDVLFREELDALRNRLDLAVAHVLLQPPEGWAGATGHVSREALRRVLPEDPCGLVYFVCGPEPMTEAAQRALGSMGVPLHRIHHELFDMA